MFSFRRFNPSRVRRCTVSLLLFTISFAGCSSLLAATPSGGDEALKEALHDDLEHYLCTRSLIEHISTLSMTISFRGDPEDIKLAVGTTQYGGGEKVTPSNVFQIGSNTKAYTAAIILKLEADGVLSIDDTVGKWLPR